MNSGAMTVIWVDVLPVSEVGGRSSPREENGSERMEGMMMFSGIMVSNILTGPGVRPSEFVCKSFWLEGGGNPF